MVAFHPDQGGNDQGPNHQGSNEQGSNHQHATSHAHPNAGAKRKSNGAAHEEGVAIIGMSCLFPGAPNLDAYWRNILNKVDAVSDPPAEAWDPSIYYDPDFADSDRVYCQRGGYLGSLVAFDPLPHGIPPVTVGGEPDQWLSLQLAHDALADADCLQLSEEVRRRTAVILGKGTYLNGGNALAVERGLVIGQTLNIIKRLHPEYTPQQLEQLRQEMKKTLPPMNAETVPGLIPNIIVGRIANRLDLMGPTYTVDAACASSLIGIQLALRDLRSGECDLALVGGAQIWVPVPTLNVFCQLGALSRRQQIRPFDKDADGTLLGEGIGMIVLKRLADAERDGDRIYATIMGVGTASDGRGASVMAPRVEGEELALRRAYEATGIDPSSVELIEAHGTGTPVGDLVEVQALTRVFGPRTDRLPHCALGSVKSMISHTMPAAGIAGIIKTALSLYHKVLPPTLNCEEPNPKLELEKTPFYLNTEARPWVHGADTPRRAGVSAFGFGGINAHVIVEEHVPHANALSPEITSDAASNVTPAATTAHLPPWESEVFILQGESQAALLDQVGQLTRFVAASLAQQAEAGSEQAAPFQLKDLAATLNRDLPPADSNLRLAVVASSLDDLQAKLERAAQRLDDPNCRRIKDVKGIYFAAEPMARQGKIACLFPGEGAQYPNMLADLCLHFPEIRACFDQADAVFWDHPRTYLLSDYLFPRPAYDPAGQQWAEKHLMQMNGAVEAIITANQAMHLLLQRLGLAPDLYLGHSTGEYSAMWAAGILDLNSEERITHFSQALHRYYEELAAQDGVQRAVLLAVGAEREQVEAIAHEAGGDVYLAMDNCPHQAVLVGEPEAVARATELVRREGLIYEQLSFDRAYHTHLFASAVEPLRAIFAGLPIEAPHTPIYSCTTAAPYPPEPAAIRTLMVDHWSEPVEFRRTIETLYDEGVRIFVEAGPRGNLSAFLEDILRGRQCSIVPANVQRRSGLTQLNHLVGILAAQGVDLNLAYLYAHRECATVAWQSAEALAALAASPPRNTKIPLATGWPMLRVPDDMAQRLHSAEDDAVAPRHHTQEDQAQERLVPTQNGQPPKMQNATENDQPAIQPLSDERAHLSQATNGHVPPAPRRTESRPVPQAPAGTTTNRAAVMRTYLATMEQFIATQEEIMRAYLTQGGRPAQPSRDHAPHAATGSQQTPVPAQPPTAPVGDGVAPSLSHSGDDAPDHTLTVEPAAVHQEEGDARTRIATQLRTLVSERTGYPAEMLDWHLDLEADLGIDSIKRVEILGTYRQRFAPINDQRLEQLTSKRTLQQILDVLVLNETDDGSQHAPPPATNHPTPTGAAMGSVMGSVAAAPDAVSSAISGAMPNTNAYPLLGHVVAWTPQQELITQRRFDLAEDRYLRDHTFGGAVSLGDADLTALAVMPLTMSLEIAAEAAACLLPGRTVIGLRDVRAYRWLAWDEGALTLQVTAQVTARRLSDSDAGEIVRVQIRNATEDQASDAPPKSPVLEVNVLLAQGYPPAPDASTVRERIGDTNGPSRWHADQLYRDVMFHGPAWQGVKAIEQTGARGLTATLQVLPVDNFLQSNATPGFVLDPVVLDAAGQVIGFWTAEHLTNGQVIFPFRVDALDLYGPLRPVGERLTCEAAIDLIGEQQVRSDIDVRTSDGQLWLRIVGWEDKRFDLPPPFSALLLASHATELSQPWPEPMAHFATHGHFACRRIAPNIAADRPFWMRVWAHRILSRNERTLFNSLRTPERRRLEWLAGRAAAKDAVRALLQSEMGITLLPADIEIIPDAQGCPHVHIVEGSRRAPLDRLLDRLPVVSLAHSNGSAVALVGLVEAAQEADPAAHIAPLVGIDIESLNKRAADFGPIAFTPEEQAIFASLATTDSAMGEQDRQHEWALRGWCVKEAVAKALGRGLVDGFAAITLASITILSTDPRQERFTVRLTGTLADLYPDLAEHDLAVYTSQQDDLVVATTLCEPVHSPDIL